MTGRPGSPAWLTRLAESAVGMTVPLPLRPPPGGGRPSAVLILFGDGPPGPDLLLVQRSPGLRRHAGQPAFPGGAIDESDDGVVAAALREAAEEARVDPAGVQVIAVLPELFIARSGFSVTPVLAWWRQPAPVEPGDPIEIAAVARVPISELADPANRVMLRYPVRARRARVPGPLDAGVGLHRDDPGPAARHRRLGTPVECRADRGPAARGSAGRGGRPDRSA